LQPKGFRLFELEFLASKSRRENGQHSVVRRFHPQRS